MRYYKTIENNYITAVGTGGGGTEISSTEYNTILTVIQNKPARVGDIDYRLKTDLTWEQYERHDPVVPEELDPEEAMNILLGRSES